MGKIEKITGDYLVRLFSSNELIDIFNELTKRVERNKPYALDLIRYFGSGMDYRNSQYGAWKYSYDEKGVKINRERRPLDDSHHSYTPEGFYFLASGHFDSIHSADIHVRTHLPIQLKESNKGLGFNSKPIGIIGMKYDEKNGYLFLWQSISDNNTSENEISDEIRPLSLAKMFENPDNFFESYNIPVELRRLPTKNEAVDVVGKQTIINWWGRMGVKINFDSLTKEWELLIEQLAAWKSCIPYVFLEAFSQERGYNASVLRFGNGGFDPEDLKTLESFAFDVHLLEVKEGRPYY